MTMAIVQTIIVILCILIGFGLGKSSERDD